jgi:hypothetical protein
MIFRFKEWMLKITEPWREERASLMLEWRIFAQKHNAKYPGDIQCAYKGMELDPMDKAEVYEFPDGDPEAPPNTLIDQHHDTWYPQPKDNLR